MSDADRQAYLHHLRAGISRFECELHAYVLMTNHIHLVATGPAPGALSKVMHFVGTRYARHVNVRHGRTGSLFEGRFKSSVIETERYFMTCMRYVELNPVRAGMACLPSEFPWSSHQANASGEPGGLLTPHELYLRLGGNVADRAVAYRALFAEPMQPAELAGIRESIGQGRVFGCGTFCRSLSEELGRNVGVGRRGRPKRGTD